MLTITLIGSSALLAYSIFLESLKTQSCSEFFPLLLLDPQKGRWTDSSQELSIPGIFSKRPLSKGIAPPSMTAKQLEDIHNYKQVGDESLQSLEELLAKHQAEYERRSTEIEGWIKKLQENDEINTRNQSASLKNLETQIEQLTKEIHYDKILNLSPEQIKTVTSDQETSGLNKLHGVSLISGPGSNTPEVLQHQLPPKELNPRGFTLPQHDPNPEAKEHLSETPGSTHNHVVSSLNLQKRISEKKTKNQAKTDKTKHRVKKRGKVKVKSKPKSTKVKVNPDKVNSQN
ncbi:hypothetical protein Tco_1107868 [Tanacetum coccineum]